MRIKEILIGCALFAGSTIQAQSENTDSLGMIGDNLDLYAVMDVFKSSTTIEKFEETINNPDDKINNLDLDQDGNVDYIQVIDQSEKDAHAFILRIAVSETESQDVAVIELEKTGDETANIQIVGNEELYGEDYIVEPQDDVAKGKMPPAIIVVNVWHWPSVRHVYGPKYTPWVSPWGWRHHPKWWKPWRPYGWRTYNGYHRNRHHGYRVVRVHRVGNAHGIYKKHRRTWVGIKNHPNHHKGNGHYKGNGHKGNNNNGHKGNNGHKTNNGHKGNNNSGGHKKGNGGGHKNNSGGHKKGGGKKHH